MILDKITKEQLLARKNRDTFKTGILTTLMSEVSIIGKNKGNRKTTDEEAIAVIKKFISNAENNIESLQGSHNWENCTESIQEFQDEIELLQGFLPKQMTEDELKVSIEVMVSKGANNIGAIMGTLKKEYGGLYDGKMASKLAKEVLSK